MVGMRVQMITSRDHPGVCDGASGYHLPGSTPVLSEDVAAAFVSKGFANYVDRLPQRIAKRLYGDWQILSYSDKLATIAFVLTIVGATSWKLL